MTDTTTPQPDANGWYTIDSAPRDGSCVLIWGPVFDDAPPAYGLINDDGDWIFGYFRYEGITHWKPLGPPPVGVGSAE
jgi:hypothetical protein